MRNIKLKIFIVLSVISLSFPVFGSVASTDYWSGFSNSLSDFSSNIVGKIGEQITSASSGVNSIVGAIQQLKQEVTRVQTNNTNAINGGSDNSLVNMLNKIFIADRSAEGQSVLDTKVDMYAKNFYSFYTTDEYFEGFKEKVSDIGKAQDAVDEGISKLLLQELAYYNQTNDKDKQRDSAALLVLPIESMANNIEAKYIKGGVSNNPIGSLGFTANKDIPEPEDIGALSVNSLIGPDAYFDENVSGGKKENKKKRDAELFLSYLFKLTPAPKAFFIPPSDKSKNNKVTISLPSTMQGAPDPIEVSVQRERVKNGGYISEYERMLQYLEANSLYQEYKMKYRIALASRTLFHNTLLSVYQKRIRPEANKGGQGEDKNSKPMSLIEKEKSMAMEGLDPEYYSALKEKSVAEVNIETLYALNKMIYFLHKISQDNEKNQLLLTINAMQMQLKDAGDETQYISPINKIFENSCWDGGRKGSESNADWTARKAACNS